MTDATQTIRAADCPVISDFNTAVGGKRPGEWVQIYDRLRAQYRSFRSEVGPRGFFVFTRRDDILEILQDPERFSSSAVSVLDPEPNYKWIPEMLDPPEHTEWRRLLAPYFSPKAIKKLETKVEQRAVELIEPLVRRDGCDYMVEFARVFPTTIFLEMFGLPVAELDKFMSWEAGILHGDPSTPEGHALFEHSMGEVLTYFGELIALRRADPKDDILSHALTFEISGAAPPEPDLLAFCLLMFMAGLDTVTQTLSYAMLHLAKHPADRAAIVADPALIPSVVEEIVRAYNIVAPSRKVMADTEVGGQHLKAGDMITLPLNSANRDVFEDGTEVKVGRTATSHLGFGAGPHRCLGSHLARRELTVALTEWHKRIPDYRIVDESSITEHGGMLGLDSLPLTWA